MNVSGYFHPIDQARGGRFARVEKAVKRVARRTIASRWLSHAWAPLIRDRVAFIMLHRFAEPEYGSFGHDREAFRGTLERLRRDGYAMLTVEDAVQRLVERRGFPHRSVVFTMDDGYRGAIRQCEDLLLAYDCPLTVFLPTGFIDGSCWLWWDQIEFVCLASGRPTLDVPWHGSVFRLQLGDRAATISSLLEISEWCKTLPDDEKWRFIGRLAQAAQVEIPTVAPPQYAPLSWAEARALEANGVISFGPHTVTHPMLPRTSDSASEWEITESWRRVQQELEHPVPVFAYPNGAHGHREIDLLMRLGLHGAVTTRGDYAAPATAAGGPEGRFEIPRFGYPEAPDPVVNIVSGFKSIELALGR
jgi:peptidoglycan/xylan/chitin deacetylase (PgdA/CDA1 family)